MEKHLSDVRRYDALADAAVVGRIVGHLGLSVYGCEGAHVATTEPAALDRVKTEWCGDRLGARDDFHVERTLELVCRTMEADPCKERVTFYYLCAKHLGKLGAI